MRKRESYFASHHPAVTFAFFLAAIVLCVTIQHPAYVASSVVCSSAALLTLRGRKALPFLGWMVPLFIVLSAINPLFSTGGRHVLFLLFGRPYTWESLCYGMVIAGMLVATLLWFGCYNEVMTSDKFTCLFGSFIPSLSLILVMILRLVPSYRRKAHQISTARQCIGTSLDTSPKTKVLESTAVLSALTSWALEGAIVTADSMRARGYGTARRTNYRLYRWRTDDTVLSGAMALFLGGTVAMLALGWTRASFIPAIKLAPVSGFGLVGLVVYTALLLLPTALNILEELKWKYSLSKV